MFQFAYVTKKALIIFPLLLVAISVTFMMYRNKKYKHYNKTKSFILYTFIFFLMSAFFVTILLIPKTTNLEGVQSAQTKHYQLIPFRFVIDFLIETDTDILNPSTYIYAFKEKSFLQAFLNIILLIPLGVYLRFYFNKTLKHTIIITFLVSLFFELIQLTVFFRGFNEFHSVFNIDDLILNTLSGYIGYTITPYMTFSVINHRKTDYKLNLRETKVGLIRRSIAFIIDYNIVMILTLVFETIIYNFKDINLNILEEIIFLIVGYVYFIVYIYRNCGKTIGKKLFNIKLVSKNNLNITKKELLVRYSTLYIMFRGMPMCLEALYIFLENKEIIHSFYIFHIMAKIYILSIFTYLFVKIFNKDELYLHDKISKTQNVMNKIL